MGQEGGHQRKERLFLRVLGVEGKNLRALFVGDDGIVLFNIKYRAAGLRVKQAVPEEAARLGEVQQVCL